MKSGDPGICTFELDVGTGALERIAENCDVENPSYLCINAARDRLYAVSEIEPGNGEKCDGYVFAFSIGPDGALTKIGSAPVSGAGATHVAANGKYLAAAEYYTGDIDLYALDDNGGIAYHTANDRHAGSGPVDGRQDCAHAHFVGFDPFNEDRLWAVDLGSDTVYVYDVSNGKLTVERTVAFPAGEGPRHLLFSKNRPELVYCVCEITFNLYAIDRESGAARFICCALGDDREKVGFGGAAAVRFGADEECVYVSNRVLDPASGMDSIACIKLDPCGNAENTEVVRTGYRFPRDMNVFAEHGLAAVAYQFDDKLQIRRICPDGLPSGILSETYAGKVCCITDLI